MLTYFVQVLQQPIHSTTTFGEFAWKVSQNLFTYKEGHKVETLLCRVRIEKIKMERRFLSTFLGNSYRDFPRLKNSTWTFWPHYLCMRNFEIFSVVRALCMEHLTFSNNRGSFTNYDADTRVRHGHTPLRSHEPVRTLCTLNFRIYVQFKIKNMRGNTKKSSVFNNQRSCNLKIFLLSQSKVLFR